MRKWMIICCVCAVTWGVAPERALAQAGAQERGGAAEARQRGAAQAGEAREKAETVGEARHDVGVAATEAREETAPREQEPARAREARQPTQSQLPQQAQRDREVTGGRPDQAVPAQGQGQAQREAARERQAERFEEIHARRIAQLERIRDLALENDRPEVVERVNNLIEKQEETHARRTGRRGPAE